jgi:hypothetical protein
MRRPFQGSASRLAGVFAVILLGGCVTQASPREQVS